MNWRFAAGVAALLTLLFGIQQWLAQPPARQDLTLAESMALQAVTWGVWLLLFPLDRRGSPARIRSTGRPPAAGWLRTAARRRRASSCAHGALVGARALGARDSPSRPSSATVLTQQLSGRVREQRSPLLRDSRRVIRPSCTTTPCARASNARRALELDLARAQLTNVEACLRPHFLFNTLNAIAALVREDPRAGRTDDRRAERSAARVALRPSRAGGAARRGTGVHREVSRTSSAYAFRIACVSRSTRPPRRVGARAASDPAAARRKRGPARHRAARGRRLDRGRGGATERHAARHRPRRRGRRARAAATRGGGIGLRGSARGSPISTATTTASISTGVAARRRRATSRSRTGARRHERGAGRAHGDRRRRAARPPKTPDDLADTPGCRDRREAANGTAAVGAIVEKRPDLVLARHPDAGQGRVRGPARDRRRPISRWSCSSRRTTSTRSGRSTCRPWTTC